MSKFDFFSIFEGITKNKFEKIQLPYLDDWFKEKPNIKFIMPYSNSSELYEKSLEGDSNERKDNYIKFMMSFGYYISEIPIIVLKDTMICQICNEYVSGYQGYSGTKTMTVTICYNCSSTVVNYN